MDLRIDYIAHKSHKVIEICKKCGNVQGKTIENNSKQYENKGNQQRQTYHNWKQIALHSLMTLQLSPPRYLASRQLLLSQILRSLHSGTLSSLPERCQVRNGPTLESTARTWACLSLIVPVIEHMRNAMRVENMPARQASHIRPQANVIHADNTRNTPATCTPIVLIRDCCGQLSPGQVGQ